MKQKLHFLALIGAFLLGSSSVFAQTYCTGGPSSTADSEIINVALLGDNYSISNLLTCPASTGVTDYTATDSADVSQGTSYTLNITFSTCGGIYSGAGRAWIDFNDDGDFTDSGEELGFWSGSPAAQNTTTYNAQFSFTVPTNATLGQTRMRVMQAEGGSTTSVTPCATFTWGTIEDYTIRITNTPPPCPIPGAFAASGVTGNTADLSWSSTGVLFDIEYGPAGFTPGTGTSTTSTLQSKTLTGLTPNTAYHAYVRNNCTTAGNGSSSWNGPLAFTTTCGSINSYPYTENFDGTTWVPSSGSSSTPGTEDNCWSRDQISSVPRWIVHTGTTGSSGTGPNSANSSANYIYMETSGGSQGNATYMYLPAFDLSTLTVPLFSFYYHMYGATMGDMVVEVSTDTGTTWTAVLTLAGQDQTANADPFKEALVDITAYKTSHTLIRMKGVRGSSFTGDMAFDDVRLEEAPPCPKPTALNIAMITSSTAQVNYTSQGTKFIMEYGPCGFSQGTGNFDTAYTTSHVITGLAANTEYEVYVMSDCSAAGNGLSPWAKSTCFRTECTAFAVPFTENFDGTPSGNSTTPSAPNCWKYERTNNGSTAYGYTMNSTTYANSGTNSWYMYQSSTTPIDTQALISPEVSGMDVTDKHVQFWARTTYVGTSYTESLLVGTVAGPGQLNTFDIIDTVDIRNLTYQFFDVYLTAANGYNGTHKYVALVPLGRYYFRIDDITIADVPACVPSTGLTVSGITSSMANLDWTPGDGGKFDIEYGPTGFTQGTGPVITGLVDSSYTITGLTGNTCYDVYVRDSCGVNSKSPWFGPITFCTACDPANTPLLEDFENVAGSGSTTTPNEPDCWSYWRNPSATYYGYSYSSLGPNGTYHWRFYQVNELDTVALISPAINGLGNGNKQIRLKCKSYYTSTTFQGIAMEVGTTPNYNSVRGGTPIDTIYGDFGQTYVNDFTVRFDTSGSGYNGTDQFIYMRPIYKPSTYYYYNFVDDINIEDVPLCSAPWNQSISNVTSSSAEASWSTVYGTAFQVEYGPTGFIPGTGGNGTIMSNVTPGVTMTGLSPNTYYDYYVADNCDSSMQTGPFTFKTLCVGQLSGAYTVGTPTSDFETLDSALAVLTGCGITSAVTFNLQGGNHIIPAQMFGSIVGLSATNTVTINGGGVGVDTISISGGTIAMDFDNIGYITFQNTTINAQGADRVVWLHNGAHHITFDHCDILGNATSTSSLTAVITASSTSTSISSTGDNASDITVTNCKISGGYYGFSVYGGGTTSFTSNYVLSDNEFVDQYYYPIRFYYCDSLIIERNMVPGVRNTSGYGMYIYYTSNAYIRQNQVYVPTYGMYLYRPNHNDATAHSEVSNNFFGSSGSYGTYTYQPTNVMIHHNSFRGNSYGLYLLGTTGLDSTDVRNNIFVSNTTYALYIGTTPTNFTLDYNLYHTVSGSSIAYQGGAHTTLTAWQTAQSSYNTNSVQGDPGFVSSTDFHILGTLPNDAGLNGLSTVDVDGDMRPASGSTNVDIGADEFTPLNWDASLEAIMVPLAGCGDSNVVIQAVVKNLGLSTITSLPVTVNVTGGITQAFNVTSTNSILQGATDTIMMGTINTYAGVAGVMFDGYTSLSGDQKVSNDTILNYGPGAYIPAEPVYYPEDTVCASLDSAYFAALTVPGVSYGWYASATDTVPVAVGDTFMFPTSGQKTWYLEYQNNADSLETTFAAGNGQSGNMFDINVKNPVTIKGFTMAVTAGGTAEVWYKSGTYVGSNTTQTAWTNLTPVAVTAAAGTPYVALPTPISLGTGIHAFYVTMSSGSVAYTNGSTVGTLHSSNSDIDFYEGIGVPYPFGSPFSPRVWNGRIHYGSVGCTDTRQALTLVLNPDSAVAAFTSNVKANGADVDFDASTSVGHLFDWNYGDGSIGIGQMTTHTYAQGGSYTVCLTVTDTVCGTVDSICKTVMATVGIDESLMNETLNVFPNPNNGKFRVEFQVEGLKDVTIRVLTLLGQEVFESKPGNVSGEYREEIDLSDNATGVYVLQIVTDDNSISRRITIRR